MTPTYINDPNAPIYIWSNNISFFNGLYAAGIIPHSTFVNRLQRKYTTNNMVFYNFIGL